MSAKPKIKSRATRITTPPRPEPTHDDIALCAMSIWEEEGRPQGRELEHWLLAEARLRQGCKAAPDVATGESSRRPGRNGSKRSQLESVVL